MLTDTHVHSHYSLDSEASMEKIVETAIEEGLGVLCFTDHIDYDFPIEDMVFDFDLGEYLAEIAALREHYGEKVRILAGVELGMQPHLGPRYNELLRKYPLDYAIGSQHLVNRQDPYFPETFAKRNVEEVYRQYFEETLENVRAFDGFDSLGHLDYVTRYGESIKPFPSHSLFPELIDEILKLLIEKGKALEVNTCGYRKGLGQPNPGPRVLRRYRELGGELVTIGADAHKAKDLGKGCKRGVECLRDLGFKRYFYYVGHEPVAVEIETALRGTIS